MYNLRYHIASLVAVFLALAMGLLLGTIVVERGVLSNQQTTLVEGLQKDFNQVRAESAAVKKTNATLTTFATQAAPKLVEGLLQGRTILVIASPETADTVSKVSSDIRAAGGTVAVATFAGADLSLKDSGVAAAAAKALGVQAGSVTETAVASELVREWSATNDPRALSKAMVSAGGLQLSGLAADATVGGTVLTATFSGKPDAAALQLASAFADALRTSVGVETTTRQDGTAAAAGAGGMSGVDDADTPLGEVSLIWVLSGRATGTFGQGANVDAPFPSPLFAAQ